jgi:hypothetical protein
MGSGDKLCSGFSFSCILRSKRARTQYLFRVVLPVLVIPDRMLWVVEFDSDGSQISSPHQINRCSYFIDKYYFGGDNIGGFPYYISHLEFVTLDGLVEMIGNLFTESTVYDVFRPDQIRTRYLQETG